MLNKALKIQKTVHEYNNPTDIFYNKALHSNRFDVKIKKSIKSDLYCYFLINSITDQISTKYFYSLGPPININNGFSNDMFDRVCSRGARTIQGVHKDLRA